MQWQTGEPKENHGYFLATWLRGIENVPTVSEAWFNRPGRGVGEWWFNRGYTGERSRGISGAIPGKVVAWMPMPEPFQQCEAP